LNQTYFKHRQEVLINRERANLPALQETALREQRRRKKDAMIHTINAEITGFKARRGEVMRLYNQLYGEYYGHGLQTPDRMTRLNQLLDESNELLERIREKKDLIYAIRWPPRGREDAVNDEEKKEEEKKKFVRRCTRDGCQGFLSTAWKCGLCEWYSCAHCFVVKGQTHDVPHECKKEDLETAELIKKDCKPCPKCGEFIQKSSGCDQMFCISCQTPFSWTSGKIVTSGPIHNPHYYEWMKRTGGAMPRNPADVPCGGFPGAWELVRFPRGVRREHANPFYEFHRICQELQDISTRNFRTHFDNTSFTDINIKFLLGELEEKKWGQQLAIAEKKKKRDGEVQEIMGAFRMAAVELVNRVQHYREGVIRSFTDLPAPEAEKFLVELFVEIKELYHLINDAFRNASISSSYSVPYIEEVWNQQHNVYHYRVSFKNFKEDAKKKRVVKKKEKDDDVKEEIEVVAEPAVLHPAPPAELEEESDDELSEEQQLQRAIHASLQ